MSDWQLIDGKTSESGRGQLIVTRGENVLGIGTLLATVHEDTLAFGDFTRTARLMTSAPELGRLAADLAGLALDLGGALADHHKGTDTTRPYRQTYDRDAALLARTEELVKAAGELLAAIEDGTDMEGVRGPGLSDVQAACELAAGAIGTLKPRQWAGWASYVLEALEERRPGEIEGFLQDLREAIETRLEAGRW